MNPIPKEAFEAILEELHRRPIGVNEYRDKCGEGRSQAFGLVNKRSLPVDYSRQNWLRPKLLYLLQEFAEKYVTVPWTSITVNQGYKCEAHRDKNNLGNSFLVAFGDFSGGELIIHEGPLCGTHDIRYKPITTDFSKVLHSVKDFEGERISLVFYTLKPTKMPDAPLPEGKAVLEDGKYVFKRGDKIITKKEGLPHPLRGRSKRSPEQPMTQIVSQSEEGFVVSFD